MCRSGTAQAGTFISEATAILMKLDCVRPRYRKLSPDGRRTDMEFEYAEMEKKMGSIT